MITSQRLYGFHKSVESMFHWLLIPLTATLLTLWPSITSGLERLQTDPGDTLLNLYLMEHVFQHVSNGQLLHPERFWSPEFFWPIKNTLAWSDHLLGPSLIYGIVRIALDPLQTYIVWLSGTLILNYVSIRLALKQISPETMPTWLSMAALLTSFSPAIIVQLGHPQLLSLFLVGPVLTLSHRLLTKPPDQFTASDWLKLGSWLLANGFFNIYVFVYACYGAMICAGFHICRRIKNKDYQIHLGRNFTLQALILIIIIGMNMIIYIPYLKTIQTFGKRPLDEILNNLPTPASWLYGASDWLFTPLVTPGNLPSGWISGVEQELFPGWGLLIMLTAAVLTFLRQRKQKTDDLGKWLAVIAVMLVGSLSIGGMSLWPWLSKALPGASSLRASSRVAIAVVLFSSPAIAIAARRWIAPCPSSLLRGLASALALTGGLASLVRLQAPAFSLSNWEGETANYQNALTSANCDLFWLQWNQKTHWVAQVQAMHLQLRTAIPTANGYSGHFPQPDWPFKRPDGRAALTWSQFNNAADYHQLKSKSLPENLCILSHTSGSIAKVEELTPADLPPANEVISSETMALVRQNDGTLGIVKRASNRSVWPTNARPLITPNGEAVSTLSTCKRFDSLQVKGNTVLAYINNYNQPGQNTVWLIRLSQKQAILESEKMIKKHDCNKAGLVADKPIKVLQDEWKPSLLISNKEESLKLYKTASNKIYLEQICDDDQPDWKLLRRDGQPIPAERKNYRIKSIRRDGPHILIKDVNRLEGITYQWVIDSSTGEFLNQTMTQQATK